ncbi:MAG TPA: tRNA lysidine(34) synthetase TilS [Methylophilaceae bacterium]|nr:tRNA lysidine(34) synthetase TilS [Methylophilaceae bacterium]
MANSKSLPANSQTLVQSVKGFLTRVLSEHSTSPPSLLLGYSGGLDSSVLLHVLVQCRLELTFELQAMHVHHGLSVNADAWADFCERTCNAYQVPYLISHISVDPASGLGVEATARAARYSALQSAHADWICLAHHQDDQAETLLLQLARGAGSKGLSGMAAWDVSNKLLRPLLVQSRQALVQYAKQHQLRWIDDESNQCLEYDRNFMRHEILPALTRQYPAITKTLSRSASHMAEVSVLLSDLACIDAQTAFKYQSKHEIQLDLGQLAMLSEARAKNLLRYWLEQYQVLMPSAEQLQQILHQLLAAKPSANIKLKVGQGLSIRRHLQLAYVVSEHAVLGSYNLLWQGESEVWLSPYSQLVFEKRLGQGIALRHLEHAKLRIKNREGGERFRPEQGRPSRTIKRMMQTHTIPPWQREHIPLIFMEEILASIPNLGVDADLLAAPDEIGLVIAWHYQSPETVNTQN